MIFHSSPKFRSKRLKPNSINAINWDEFDLIENKKKMHQLIFYDKNPVKMQLKTKPLEERMFYRDLYERIRFVWNVMEANSELHLLCATFRMILTGKVQWVKPKWVSRVAHTYARAHEIALRHNVATNKQKAHNGYSTEPHVVLRSLLNSSSLYGSHSLISVSHRDVVLSKRGNRQAKDKRV